VAVREPSCTGMPVPLLFLIVFTLSSSEESRVFNPCWVSRESVGKIPRTGYVEHGISSANGERVNHSATAPPCIEEYRRREPVDTYFFCCAFSHTFGVCSSWPTHSFTRRLSPQDPPPHPSILTGKGGPPLVIVTILNQSSE